MKYQDAASQIELVMGDIVVLEKRILEIMKRKTQNAAVLSMLDDLLTNDFDISYDLRGSYTANMANQWVQCGHKKRDVISFFLALNKAIDSFMAQSIFKTIDEHEQARRKEREGKDIKQVIAEMRERCQAQIDAVNRAIEQDKNVLTRCNMVLAIKSESHPKKYDPLFCLNVVERLPCGKVRYSMSCSPWETPRYSIEAAKELEVANSDRMIAIPYRIALNEAKEMLEDCLAMYAMF